MITGDNMANTLPLDHFLVFNSGRSMATRLKSRFYDLVSWILADCRRLLFSKETQFR